MQLIKKDSEKTVYVGKVDHKMRQRIFEIVESAKDNDKVSTAYDCLMMAAILISLIPLLFKESYPIFELIDRVTVIIFIIDYLHEPRIGNNQCQKEDRKSNRHSNNKTRAEE